MFSWKGKTRGGVLGYSIFIFILKYFNIDTAYFILRFVALYFLFFSPNAFKSIFYFYNKRLNYGFIKSIYHIYLNYYVFGQTILDKVALFAGYENRFVFDFADEVYLNHMIEKNSGGILISAHVGNWEISGQLLSLLKGKFNILMLDVEHESIKKQLDSAKVQRKMNIILMKNDFSHIYEINNALMNNEFLCLHGDRFLNNSKTIECDFFGEKARFPYGVFYLAVKYNVPVTFVFAIKTGKKAYHFFTTPPKYFYITGNKKDVNENIENVLKEYVLNLEKEVRKYPDQWFNYFRFWNRII